MKYLTCISILLLCMLSANAQIPSSCSIPQILQTYYDKDVKHLALTRINALQSPYMDSIDIPQTYLDTIWQGLSAIFNVTTINERDSVFDEYCIHQVNNCVVNKIIVGVNMTYAWTQNWQNLNTYTGIPALDNLLSTYGFTITYFTSTIHYAILTTNQEINLIPLCDSIEYFAGVNYAEPSVLYGGGDEISYNKVGNDKYFNFTVGYGDCPSMCTSMHTFKFKVYNDCSVDYLGIEDIITPGDVLPTPDGCNITTNIRSNRNTNIEIYPNPANEILYINMKEKALLEIINIQGEIMVSKNLNENSNSIDISNLKSGIYTLKIKTEKGIAFKKLIKQ